MLPEFAAQKMSVDSNLGRRGKEAKISGMPIPFFTAISRIYGRLAFFGPEPNRGARLVPSHEGCSAVVVVVNVAARGAVPHAAPLAQINEHVCFLSRSLLFKRAVCLLISNFQPPLYSGEWGSVFVCQKNIFTNFFLLFFE